MAELNHLYRAILYNFSRFKAPRFKLIVFFDSRRKIPFLQVFLFSL